MGAEDTYWGKQTGIHHTAIQWDTVRYSAIQWDTVRYSDTVVQ